MSHSYTNIRPDFDQVLEKIANYVVNETIDSEDAYKTAHWCLLDSIGCALLALNYSHCTNLLGPIVPGTTVPNGVPIPGTEFVLDPVQAAFNLGTMIRWLDFNDTWLAAEWGHPSDNIGGILTVADYLNRSGQANFTIRDVLTAMIKAYEIQGVLALENSYNRVGLDHVVLVKVATTAVVTQMLGGDKDAVLRALSQAWVDGQSLRTYRHAPNTGSRKSWAAGDATSRGVRLAMITLKGEMGYPSVLTAPKWGFYDVLFQGKTFSLPRPFGSYVMENILFKISYPAEFHAQTAVECALQLYPEVRDRIDQITNIKIITHESAMRIINKTGPLHNSADRDHCLQYMVAVPLLFGELKADHYLDEVANDPRIDALREKMEVIEDKQYSIDYLDQDKRSIANSMEIFFSDGSKTEKVTVEYPLGHQRRRTESLPAIERKFKNNLDTRFAENNVAKIMDVCLDKEKCMGMSASKWLELFIK